MTVTDEIYQKYARTVFRFLMSRVHNEDIAEELTQETFFQAVRTIDRFDGSCALSTWLCAIAKNQLHEYCRRHPQTEEVSEYTQSVQSSEETVFTAMERVELMRRLHMLEEPYREILLLRIYGSLSFREIGEIFSKNENWARVTYYRGRAKLRKEIEDETDSM